FELDRLRNFRIAFGKRRRVEILVGRIDLVACRHGLSVPRCLVVGATVHCTLFAAEPCRGDTPRETAIPAEPARPCAISADNAAIFRDQAQSAASGQSFVAVGMAGRPNPSWP